MSSKTKWKEGKQQMEDEQTDRKKCRENQHKQEKPKQMPKTWQRQTVKVYTYLHKI